MNCTKCQDTGWICEEHPEQMQGHIKQNNIMRWPCNGAGIPCTCDAFPHKKKHTPLEAWLDTVRDPIKGTVFYMAMDTQKQAIAVIEKLKNALEFYAELNELQVKATWGESNPHDKDCAEMATQIIQSFWEPLTEKARAAIAIDPEKL